MQALHTFFVRSKLPEPLQALDELAMNLRWSWHRRTQELFRHVDPEAWERNGRDPRALLATASLERLDTLAGSAEFRAELGEVHADLQRYMTEPRWFHQRPENNVRSVAYFSPEFGLSEALPQYSGGLGALAGDHLKAASDLGLPLTGVGLLYRQGYFRQGLNADGWQVERYPTLDPHALPIQLVQGAAVTVNLAGVQLVAHIWQAEVGRVPLLLLDADVADNDPDARLVTDRLYGGGSEHRLRQEIVLGVGGVRALETLGIDSQIFHTNEGHAGFLGLERIRRLIIDDGLSLSEAVEAVRSGTIFTTHTPVAAGIDRFPRDLMERYFKPWANECDVDFDDLMAIGHLPGEPPDAPFNMAVMGLRLAGASNGVSKLHGEVTRAMYQPLWPGLAVQEVPIGSVTNGVHARSWVSSEMDELLSRHVSPVWPQADSAAWAGLPVPDDELWRARNLGRERLVARVRRRLRSSALALGASPSDAAWCDSVLDPAVLTIGFARRFAAYKRATLLLSQPGRLEALLLSPDRPVQLVFAGKAHPADHLGKEMIRQVVEFSRRPRVRHRMVFVDDYDIALARTLYQGCDVWLNNPRRPLEACGTSGEKAALNGALNCSVLDGWWSEMFNGENGWAISSAETSEDLVRRDAFEAASLFDVLEHQVVPLFYAREDDLPRPWLQRMRASLVSLGPQVVADRMLRDYVEGFYEPMGQRADAVRASNHARAKALSAWKERVRAGWPEVAIQSVDGDSSPVDLGAERVVEAVVHVGPLSTEDIAVELLHGPLGPDGELGFSGQRMELVGPDHGNNRFRYRGRFTCGRAGRYGYTARVVPNHPDLAHPAEMGCVAWA